MGMKESALALLCMQRHSWEQGVCMQAFYEMGEGDVVIRLAKEAPTVPCRTGAPPFWGTATL